MPSLKLTQLVPKTTAVFPDDLMYLVDGTPTSHSMTFGDMARNATDRYDVRDYGAIGNGVADDTTAIQATIDAARTSGPSIVYMPKGMYRLTT